MRLCWRTNILGNLILEYPHQLLQNIKNTSFYTFWSKNTHFSGCKIVYKCTSVTITVHICIVTVTFTFNILVFFFLSLCLWLLSFSPHSPFFSFDQIIRMARPLNHLSPLISRHRHWSLVDCHKTSPITNHFPLFLVVRSMGFELGGWWFGFPLFLVVSCCLISGFFGRGVYLTGLNGLAFLDDGG